ncbi:MAG: molybdopterin-dependent oxidoreductase, partial [Nitrospinota bacterium]|nr:molybdopterin-dependent oxidoreductase [Nitrospinota bacterium]
KDPRGLIGATFDGPSFLPLGAFLSGFGSPNFTAASAGFFCGNGLHPVAYILTGSNDAHPDLRHCRYMVQFGTHYGFVAQNNAMGMAQELSKARDRGMRLVVIDPVLSTPASQADEWVPIRPGTDAALALSMMNVLINELDLHDAEYLRLYTNLPYLVGEDGRYVREKGTDKPLLFDRGTDRVVPYDAADGTGGADVALEGSYTVDGQKARTAFELFREHLKGYPPEEAASITTIPAKTIRRLAREFGEAAHGGGTIELDGHTLPLRPAVATWYRGVSAHKHGMLNGLALAQLNITVGAVDVPGGLLNAASAGPGWFPKAGYDGYITSENPFTPHHNSPSPPFRIDKVNTLELAELFPVSVYARAMLWLGILEGERYGVPYQPEMLIQCRTNFMATTADPEIMAEALRRIRFILSFAAHHNETAHFADLVMPDSVYLERQTGFALNPYVQYRHVPGPGGEWAFNVQQPVVKAPGDSEYWVKTLYEAARRAGFHGDVYSAFNHLARLEGEDRLDPAGEYAWEEICDHWLKAWCGAEHGLDYFRENGCLSLKPRTVPQSYPRPFHTGRIPVYMEYFLEAGEEVGRYVREHNIPWDLSDYIPLMEWRPCHAYEPQGEHDLFLVNHKVPFLTFTFTAENPWIMDLAERSTKVFTVGINPATARRKGLKDGQEVRLETPFGRSAEATLRWTEGVHPECLSVPGLLGRKITKNSFGKKGLHFNSLIAYTFEQFDTVAAAVDACVRVKVTPS